MAEIQKKKIIVIINAKKTEVYWAKYIRNKESIWIGEQTESLLKKKLIKNEINNLSKKWIIVGYESQIIEFKDFLHTHKTQFFLPNAKDIIPFALSKIKNIKLLSTEENNINYLYNEF